MLKEHYFVYQNKGNMYSVVFNSVERAVLCIKTRSTCIIYFFVVYKRVIITVY